MYLHIQTYAPKCINTLIIHRYADKEDKFRQHIAASPPKTDRQGAKVKAALQKVPNVLSSLSGGGFNPASYNANGTSKGTTEGNDQGKTGKLGGPSEKKNVECSFTSLLQPSHPDGDLYPSERVAMLYSPQTIGLSARRVTMHEINWGRPPNPMQIEAHLEAPTTEENEFKANKAAWEHIFETYAKRYEQPQAKKKSFFLPLELFDSSIYESATPEEWLSTGKDQLVSPESLDDMILLACQQLKLSQQTLILSTCEVKGVSKFYKGKDQWAWEPVYVLAYDPVDLQYIVMWTDSDHDGKCKRVSRLNLCFETESKVRFQERIREAEDRCCSQS